MTKENNGGPALPFSMHPEHGFGPSASTCDGMSMRDWFAGQALAGLCASHAHTNSSGYPNNTDDIIQISIDSYKIAEGMLAERQKRIL